jgi:hypothetical protein
MKYVLKIMSVSLLSFAGTQILLINKEIHHRKYACRYIVRKMVRSLDGRLKIIPTLKKKISKEMECIVILDLPIHRIMILQLALHLII